MHELVIVVSDLYLSQETPEQQLPDGIALPGLQYLSRYGTRSRPSQGWRRWVVGWSGGGSPGADAATADAATSPLASAVGAQVAPATVAALAVTASTAVLTHPATVWMATPVHLIAGISSAHLDRRSLLRLSEDDRVRLADEFQRIFDDSGFRLAPLDSGDFLLFGPQMSAGQESEPARFLGDNVAEARQARASDPALRRLSTEIEMWLHEHPINEVRRRRGEAPVTGLWLWGGGTAPEPRLAAAEELGGASAPDIAFGRDAFLDGLWRSRGLKVLPLPAQVAEVFSYPHAQRALLVIEIGSMLHSVPTRTFFDALAHIDRVFIAPAVEAVRSGSLQRLVLLANDRQLTLRRRDRFKVWRRMPAGLSGLQ